MATSMRPPMDNIMVFVFARTDIGMHRSGNEDAFLVADLTTGNVGLGPDMSVHRVGERGSLMVVSDGMGGAVAGEIASELAVTTIRESLMEMPLDLNISERLKMATEIANERIWNHAQENPELTGMGATLTAVLVQTNIAYIAQVGDSRAYLIRGEQIKQLTKDQSLAQMLVDSGAIKPDQIASVPQNVIMQALGTQPSVKVALTAVELFRNDCLLICSDGLSNKISAEEMRQMTTESENLTVACRRLVEIANERGGEDNITVITARFDGEALHATTESSSITGSFVTINEDYISEKTADLANQYAPPPSSSSPPPEDTKQPTTMVMQAIPPSLMPGSQETIPDGETQQLGAEAPGGAPETELPAPPEAQAPPEPPAIDDTMPDPPAMASEIPTMETPVPTVEAMPAPRKKNYGVILLVAFLSLLLLAAAAYFFYFYYYKPRMGQTKSPDAVEKVAEATNRLSSSELNAKV